MTGKHEEPQVVGFLGVGLDNKDGHVRTTQGNGFYLIGGSEETHERLQDSALQFTRKLKGRRQTQGESTMEDKHG